MIYFYNDQSGSIGRAFKNCDYFKKDDTNIPPYKIFDKSPELVKYTYYDKVQKMNISAKIKEEDQNKKILLVITYSNLEMLDSILKGLDKNRENYYGVLFIGNVINNDCLPDDIEKIMENINYLLVEFQNLFSISYNDIYDVELKEMKLKYLKRVNSNFLLLFINQNKINSYEKNNLNVYYKNKHNYLENYVINNVIEFVYLVKCESIYFDLQLKTIYPLCIFMVSKLEENYLNKKNKDYEKFPEEILTLFFKYLRYIKKEFNLLLFINSSYNLSYNILELEKTQLKLKEVKNHIIPKITFKTDNYYKFDVIDYIKITTSNYNKIHDNFCFVCHKFKKFYCKACKISPYCSKACQEFDWKYLNHKKICKDIFSLNYLLKSEFELNRECENQISKQNKANKKGKKNKKKNNFIFQYFLKIILIILIK